MTDTRNNGRELALEALSGRPTEQIPVAVFTWGFAYAWKIAGLEPWQLACGGHDSWHKAHMAILTRHQPDVIWYEDAGSGPQEAELVEENDESWVILEHNSGVEFELFKNSLCLRDRNSGHKGCDPVGEIRCREDADRLIPKFSGWGSSYLDGLRKLILEVGDRALVLPHHSPAYICACYALGFERAMETMLTEPELFNYVCGLIEAGDKLRMKELADVGAEAVFIGDAWASCDIISPQMCEQFALPYQDSIIRAAHEAGLLVILYNEGDILPILKQEAALEMDAFAFEQPRKGIEITVDKVRQTFGPTRCLFGNLDSELLFMKNDPEEIARSVAQQIRQSGQGSPFILSTGSPIPSNIEPEAVDTMIQAARNL